MEFAEVLLPRATFTPALLAVLTVCGLAAGCSPGKSGGPGIGAPGAGTPPTIGAPPGAGAPPGSYPVPQQPIAPVPGQPIHQGTQHGGGNVVDAKSTVEEVNRAIDIAWDLMADRYFFAKPIAQYFREAARPKESSKYTDHEKTVLAKIEHPETYFLKSRVRRKDQGACGTEKMHTDASVTAFEVGAEVCLSIENLTKVPRTLLLRQVVSLLIHEAVHLQGFQEEDAVKIQSRIYDYFTDEFDPEKAEKAWPVVGADILQMEGAIRVARNLHANAPNSFDVYSNINEAINLWMQSTQFSNYTWINYDFKKSPKVRSVEPNFYYSYMILMYDFYQLRNLMEKNARAEPTGNELALQLAKTEENLKTAFTNFLAFAHGNTKPICLMDFPGVSGSPDEEAFKNNQNKCQEIAQNWHEDDPKAPPHKD